VVAGDADLAGLLAARHVYNAAESIPQTEEQPETAKPLKRTGT
jgi:hypothetical protein